MPANRRLKTDYPQLLLKTAQVTQIMGCSSDEIAKLAAANLLPGQRTTEKSDRYFFLPQLFRHFSGENYSLTECLAFVSVIEDMDARLRIAFLEKEQARLVAENLELRERLDVARKALA